MNLINPLKTILFFTVSTWIAPLLFIPISIIQNLFGINTKYWSVNYSFFVNRILGVNVKYVNDTKRIETGFIIANHRSFCDFFLDPLISNGSIVSRHMATIAVLPGAILAMLDGRYISISRNQSRNEIFERILDYMKRNPRSVIFFPEGTRRKHAQLQSIEQTKEFIKPGLLKSIYEYKKYPVQLQLTNNKEYTLDEKNLLINFGVTATVFLSKPIYPEDYNSFDDFFDEICKQWFENWIVPTF